MHFWEINLKKPETEIQKNICTPMSIAELLTIVKIGKQLKCPSPSLTEWIKNQLRYIYRMENSAAIKTKEILPVVTAWMNLESVMVIEISQSEPNTI